MGLPHTLNVKMSREFAEQWFTRDADGNRLIVEWGEPDEEGFYIPVITVDCSDNIATPESLNELDKASVELYCGVITKEQWREVVRLAPEAQRLIRLAVEAM